MYLQPSCGHFKHLMVVCVDQCIPNWLLLQPLRLLRPINVSQVCPPGYCHRHLRLSVSVSKVHVGAGGDTTGVHGTHTSVVSPSLAPVVFTTGTDRNLARSSSVISDGESGRFRDGDMGSIAPVVERFASLFYTTHSFHGAYYPLANTDRTWAVITVVTHTHTITNKLTTIETFHKPRHLKLSNLPNIN